MTKEEYIKHLIRLSGNSVKSYAKSIDLPYTTLLGMLKNGLGGAAVENVFRVCKGLDITVDDLLKAESSGDIKEPFYINPHEKSVITNYRDKPEMQPAVDAILGLDREQA